MTPSHRRLSRPTSWRGRVDPQSGAGSIFPVARLSATLPPLSWTVFEIEAAREQ
jgi:hypothetical protein